MRESKTQSDFQKSTLAFCTSPCISSACSHSRRKPSAVVEGVFLAHVGHGARGAETIRPRAFSVVHDLRKELLPWLRSEISTGTGSLVSLELPSAEQNGTSAPHVSLWRWTSCTTENQSTVRSTRDGWNIFQLNPPPRRPDPRSAGVPSGTALQIHSKAVPRLSAVEQLGQLARFITWRSQVQILPAPLVRPFGDTDGQPDSTRGDADNAPTRAFYKKVIRT